MKRLSYLFVFAGLMGLVFGGCGESGDKNPEDDQISDMGDDTGCTPRSEQEICAANEMSCGQQDLTECGTILSVDCGMCESPDTCVEGVCGCAESDEAFCARQNTDCGSVTADDLCGNPRTISCGACELPETCGGQGTDNVCACTPESDVEFCERLGKNCQAIFTDDSCGEPRTVNCGACTNPETCGGAGTPNVCGCTPESDAELCANAEKDCDAFTFTDSCGGSRTVNCGICIDPDTCGGGGGSSGNDPTPNVCACTPEDTEVFCSRFGKDCGSFTEMNNCEYLWIVGCGVCPSGETCGATVSNVCG